MEENVRASVENKVMDIAKLADSICQNMFECTECPFYKKIDEPCMVEEACEVAADIKKKREEEPTYEELPIDLDDNMCDTCEKPNKFGCFDTHECKERYPFMECCMDNLQDNVGKILFKYGIVNRNLAKVIIDIINKERERNESLYVHRKYFED